MEENERIVRDFLEAWSRLDPDELAGYFTEDAVYHNMPVEPVRGRENIHDFIAGFIADWTETRWEIEHLLVDKDRVMVERVDHTRVGDREVHLPLVGVFELRDGKIRAWRDYFDMATYAEAIG